MANYTASLVPNRGGLAEALGFKPNPFTSFIGDNRNALLGLAAGIAGGPNWGQGISNGLQFAAQGRQTDQAAAEKLKAEAMQAKQTNATRDWLAQNYPDLAQAVDAGLPVSEAWQEAFNRKNAKTTPIDPTSTVEGRQQLAQQYGLAGQEAQMYVLTGKLPGGNDTARYGNAPIYARNKQTGEYIAIQPGSDGSMNNLSAQLPPGFEIDPGALSADRAAGTAMGTAQGTAQFSLPSAKANLEQELANIAALKADSKGKQETFGSFGPIPQQWLPTAPATDKFGYKQRVDQVVGENFLQAFNSLKGAGAITEQEGAKAQAAMGRLSTSQKQEDFDQALADLEAVLKKGYEVLQQKAGMSFSSGGSAPAGNTTSTGVTWSVSP